MSQGQAIDIMTFNSYGLQYYSFRKGKIGFARMSQGQVIDIMTFNPKSQTYIKNHIFWWLKDGYVEIIL